MFNLGTRGTLLEGDLAIKVQFGKRNTRAKAIECKNNDVWGDTCDQPCPEECKRQDVTCNRSTGRSGISILLDGKEIFVTNDETPDPVYIPNNKRRKWTGQVLKLRRKGRRTDPLMICEVEVFNCMPGFYGYECEGICEKPVCDNGKFCSRIDGSCKETVEVKETTDCSPLILVAGYVVGFLIISLFIFAAKVIPYKKKPKREAVKKEAEGDKVNKV
ncbi:hypothetical protein C0Q70_15597 [Pomacea canaliculata]|uniref:Uncharacterized protein n=1 Tax=Pomacea canaliculata TaxID=400727 RepID=A0A2T7NV97_POMCA|nr:hypothetical protein C0Q70_15597 [Pomacea canaliculata]